MLNRLEYCLPKLPHGVRILAAPASPGVKVPVERGRAAILAKLEQIIVDKSVEESAIECPSNAGLSENVGAKVVLATRPRPRPHKFQFLSKSSRH
jgi:hypothetical protein